MKKARNSSNYQESSMIKPIQVPGATRMKDSSTAGAHYGFDPRTNQQSTYGRNQSSKSIKPEASLRLSKNYPTESGIIDTNAVGATIFSHNSIPDDGNTLSS
jgi:hypothetical protein